MGGSKQALSHAINQPSGEGPGFVNHQLAGAAPRRDALGSWPRLRAPTAYNLRIGR